ncbi:MAG: hypothetical protein HY979_03470 [Candidatus Magasanikbacteria bacterium]|nr:hypothetical protein [Candidatus Magasanikbacteria bacterium]
MLKVFGFLFVFAGVFMVEESVVGIVLAIVQNTCAIKFSIWADLAFAVGALATAVVVMRRSAPQPIDYEMHRQNGEASASNTLVTRR